MRFQFIALGFVAAGFGCTNEVGDFGNVMGAGNVGTDEEAMTSKCADGPTVKGIDISYYQGTINWSRVKNDGVKYAFIRVSDGAGFFDPKFDENWRGAKAAGVPRGVYQFFEADQDPIAQADLMLRHMGKLEPGDLPPVLDVEDGSDDGQSAHTIATKTRQWTDYVTRKTGVKPIIYTGPYHWVDSVASADFNDLKLFVAHYGTRCPYVPPTWTHWTFHQWTSTARVDGISGSVDMDDFNGTLADLDRLRVGSDIPRECSSGHYHGEYCDDDGHAGEDAHDRLKRVLDVSFSCGDVGGSPAYCGAQAATRAETLYVITKGADVPLAGHRDAFNDDDHNRFEKFINAAHAFGMVDGDDHHDVRPDHKATRNMLAAFLVHEYRLPDVHHDYFYDDDGDADEHVHNAAAAAGLFVGYDERGRTRNAFKGDEDVTRTQLAVVALRAHDKGLVPVWKMPEPCVRGNYQGAYCDDDNNAAAEAADSLFARGVDLTCREFAGSPALCPRATASRVDAIYVLGKSGRMPLTGLRDAFHDDDGVLHEKFLDGAAKFGVLVGATARPNEDLTRDALALFLDRTYDLPPTNVDYFVDDNGDPAEARHNRVAAAGLMNGFDVPAGRAFKGSSTTSRAALLEIAKRAVDDPTLVPVWR